MVCRDLILPEFCKPCLFLFSFQFAKLILPYQALNSLMQKTPKAVHFQRFGKGTVKNDIFRFEPVCRNTTSLHKDLKVMSPQRKTMDRLQRVFVYSHQKFFQFHQERVLLRPLLLRALLIKSSSGTSRISLPCSFKQPSAANFADLENPFRGMMKATFLKATSNRYFSVM